ncbi:hypothetical protein FXN63_09410 [Pigmentiphaga aceris]|uniref:Xcc1710-like domain-containing protein n=1 Tax=Pigmentiphaga aceris TaxID=1940612 RepID=A0A5C0AUD6_9BURK|nr:Mth938-like domain-containing protein [Pigmentiphaga aceris]QEI06029.1 hypothetical protein FXN63_09410 [Pigmentiphaga aceris]
MRLHVDSNPNANTITAYGSGYLDINKVRHDYAVTFGTSGTVERWPVTSVDDINADALAQASKDQPEVLLIGTGSRQRFLTGPLIKPLLKAGIGVEVMTTQAAARTFNILVAEGRRVRIALIPEQDA